MKFSDITVPLVSVVLPVYNREETIGRAISSVLNQSYQNIELIVVDDCSNDNSLKVICEFQDERIRVIALKRNLGANAARNKGIMEARGEYVAFQDSDDEWDKDKLQLQIKDMLSRNLLASFCAHRLIDSVRETIIPNDYDNKEKYETELADVLANHNVISTQTLVVRKDIFRIIGDFDEEMPRLQDYEFVIRLVQREKIGYIAQPLVSVYRTQISISTNTEALQQAIILLLKKHGDFLDKESLISLFWDTELNELDLGETTRLYANCVQFQNMLAKDNIYDVNITEYVVERLAQKYCLNNHLKKRLYEHRMSELESDNFVLYGTGYVAQKICRELKDKSIYPRGFLVTKNKKEEAINGIPVYTVEEWNNRDILVVVGVALTLQNEIVDTLICKGYKHIFCYPYL